MNIFFEYKTGKTKWCFWTHDKYMICYVNTYSAVQTDRQWLKHERYTVTGLCFNITSLDFKWTMMCLQVCVYEPFHSSLESDSAHQNRSNLLCNQGKKRNYNFRHNKSVPQLYFCAVARHLIYKLITGSSPYGSFLLINDNFINQALLAFKGALIYCVLLILYWAKERTV